MDINELISWKKVFPVVDEIRQYSFKIDDNYEKLDKRIQPITVAQVKELKSLGYNCPTSVSEGMILMFHPYLPKTIVEATMTTEDFIYQKLQHYSSILNLLGANEQTLVAKCKDIYKRNISANGTVSKGNKVAFKKSQINKKYSDMSVSVEGGKMGWSYNEGLALAREYGLERDPFIESILAKRHQRPIRRFKEKKEISSEYNSTMNITANIQVMKSNFQFEGNVSIITETIQKVFLEQDLLFID